MIERFFKEECVWAQLFADRDNAVDAIASWMDRYDFEPLSSALCYLTPAGYQERFAA